MSPVGRPRRLIASPGWVTLLAAILEGMPKLPGAACVQHVELFDFDGIPGEADTDRAAEAIRVCWRCPTLDECRAWVDSLPPKRRPRGVIAARWQPRLHSTHSSRVQQEDR